MRSPESWLRRFCDWLHWLIAEKLFPPIESPAMKPLRGRRGHAAASIVEDWWESGYHGDHHGDPTEDDKWPDQDETAPSRTCPYCPEDFRT
jgi:hypothetical protein